VVLIPANPKDDPTAFRPDDGFAFFAYKVGVAQRFEKLDAIPIVHSIYELRPELAAAKEAQRVKLEDD
jgi:hypothetical protein